MPIGKAQTATKPIEVTELPPKIAKNVMEAEAIKAISNIDVDKLRSANHPKHIAEEACEPLARRTALNTCPELPD